MLVVKYVGLLSGCFQGDACEVSDGKYTTSPGVSSLTHLCECHPGDDGEHDFLSFGGVGVLLVLLQPGLQGAGGFPSGGLGS